MFDKFIKLFALLMVLMFGNAHAAADEKIVGLKRVNAITAKLLAIAEQSELAVRKGKEPTSGKDIQRLIASERNLDVLARVGGICLAYMHPGRPEDQGVDNVLDEMWRASIRRIEEIGGDAAISTLEAIEREYRLDGGYSVLLERSLERLKQKKKCNRSPRRHS